MGIAQSLLTLGTILASIWLYKLNDSPRERINRYQEQVNLWEHRYDEAQVAGNGVRMAWADAQLRWLRQWAHDNLPAEQ